MNAEVALDSSALVAVLNREAEAVAFDKVIGETPCIVGWPTIFETRIWAVRNLGRGESGWLNDLLGSTGLRCVPFDGDLERWAHEAYANFGKGKHPAKLNFGDCMAYAVARQYDLPLLFKGGDFGQTDIRVHPASLCAPTG